MSEPLRVSNDRDLAHIVRTDDGNYYYVDNVSIGFGEYETMVFEANKAGDVECWSGEYCERHTNYKATKERHNYIINHLEEVL